MKTELHHKIYSRLTTEPESANSTTFRYPREHLIQFNNAIKQIDLSTMQLPFKKPIHIYHKCCYACNVTETVLKNVDYHIHDLEWPTFGEYRLLQLNSKVSTGCEKSSFNIMHRVMSPLFYT